MINSFVAVMETKKNGTHALNFDFMVPFFFYNIALIWSDSWFKILKTAISGYRDKGV